MADMKIEIELLSETIFGCGEAVSNSIDIEVLQDNIGLPYMKGKTFKGKLREEVEEIVKLINLSTKKDFSGRVIKLFGEESSFTKDVSNVLENLKFSNCRVSKNIKDALEEAVVNGVISKEDVLNSFTDIRSFTSIDKNGITKKGSLRQARVVKKSFKYYVDINTLKKLDNIDKGILCMGISALRNIGSMESRGKGNIICKFIENNKDMTKFYIENLEKELN